MTPGRLRAKMRKIRDHGEAMAEEGGELNLIPYLDIVTNVIMFMLATTTFAAALGDINISTPTAGGASVENDPNKPPPKASMNLTVSVSEAGFTIAASGAVLHQGFSIDAAGNIVDGGGGIPSIPKKGADYDYEGLKTAMFNLKKSPQGSQESQVTINANPGIIYEVIVQVLDNCRGKAILKDDPANPGKKIAAYEGFGDVLLSAGIN